MKLLVLLVVGLVACGEAKLSSSVPSLKSMHRTMLKELKEMVAENPLWVGDHPMRKSEACDGSIAGSIMVGTKDCSDYMEEMADEEGGDGMPDPNKTCTTATDLDVEMQCYTALAEAFSAIAENPACVEESEEGAAEFGVIACYLEKMSSLGPLICAKDATSGDYCITQLEATGMFDGDEEDGDAGDSGNSGDGDSGAPEEEDMGVFGMDNNELDQLCRSTCFAGTYVTDVFDAMASMGECDPQPGDDGEDMGAIVAMMSEMFSGACEKNENGDYCIPIVMDLTAGDENDVCGDFFSADTVAALAAEGCCGGLDGGVCKNQTECKAFVSDFNAKAGCCTAWFFDFSLTIADMAPPEEGEAPVEVASLSTVVAFLEDTCKEQVVGACESAASQAAVTVVTLLCAVIIAVVM